MIKNKYIYFFIGTTAELIKVFPIMQIFDLKGIEYKIISSGQNKLDEEIMKRTSIKPISISLFDGNIKQSALGLLYWFFTTLFKSVFKIKKEFSSLDKNNTYMLVHGDTVSTVMGALLAKINRVKIVHIEAGLRSFNYFKPFPEEIDRMIVSNIADIHCCPNEWSMKNVLSKKGKKVNTIQNTLLDSLNFALSLDMQSDLINKLKGKRFFVFVFHRQENLFDQALTKKIIPKISLYAEQNIPVLMILHSPTKVALEKYGLYNEIQKQESFMTTGRLNYFEFMKVLSMAEFLVTDGGSNQEESYYFGLPSLILRKETERNEGLDHNVVLSNLDDTIIDNFLENPAKYRKEFVSTSEKPSNIVVDAILGD